jgi:mRNA-degrading endonuclease RelE of RelBE toxin-antitoxin system
MSWKVSIPKRVGRNLDKLPIKVQKTLTLLVQEIEDKGPVRGNWPNYGKLGRYTHHCHLKKGKSPTYVAVWNESLEEIKLVEVTYVGTHEKAPY